MKLKDLKAGDIVEIDDGFTCMEPGEHIVYSNRLNHLYLQCSEGEHFLAGQEDFYKEGGELFGVKWPNEDWPS